MSVRVEHDDMMQAIPRLVAEGAVCDAVVTDPPYHLLPTQRRFGAANSAPAQYGRDGAMARLSGGFMGQRWDGGDIAFRPETWATIATVMRPGAFLLAFGGTRTAHRMVCAIEDAGFIIQDTIAWMYGTGFPKRRDMLKPAFEPLCLAYKPGGKRTMQIDECRIESGPRPWREPAAPRSGAGSPVYGSFRLAGSRAVADINNLGRWPANVAHDGSDEVLARFPQSAGQLYTRPKLPKKSNGIYGDFNEHEEFAARGNTGSAARFFYCAKADASDRLGSRHPTIKPVSLLRWLVALVTPPGGLVLDPFAGSGTTGQAAIATGRRAILIEREAEYVADIKRRIAYCTGGGPLFDEAPP